MTTFTPLGSVQNQFSIESMQPTYGVGGSQLEQSQKVQDKLKFALVDSGMGGGMTAAFLKGEVRQLGSYFCLPIGDKKPALAEAYTAAMALWPLIAPLSDGEGQIDGHIAEHVIIA